MASRIPKNPAAKLPAKAPGGSQNLSRAMKELESAFADWESLGQRPPQADAVTTETSTAAASNADSPAKEFRKKTQTLLDQLRQQLAELAD